MSRRRRRKHATVSLFAFQDVMAAVIGVLFFVVLLLALNLVDAGALAASAAANAPSPEALEDLGNQVTILKERLSDLEEQGKEAAGRTERVLAGGERAELEEVLRLDASLKALYKRIQKVEEGKRRAALERLAPQAAELEKRKQELAAIEKELARRKSDDQAKTHPRVTYILQAGPDSVVPWLIELSGKSLRAAPKDGGSAVVDFTAPTHALRQKLFLAWARQQDTKTHYFVLLIKPSGSEYAYPLGQALRKLRFQIGTDLLPEEWRAFE